MDILSNDIYGIHTTLFVADINKINYLAVAGDISKKMSLIFSGQPQILDLPDDAPPDMPRCIFQQNGIANIIINKTAISFNASIKDGEFWKENIKSMYDNLFEILDNNELGIIRSGISIEAKVEEKLIAEMKERIHIDKVSDAVDTVLSWNEQSNRFNVNINIASMQLLPIKNTVTIDVNTKTNWNLHENGINIKDVGNEILSNIERKIENVFE